MNRRLAVIFVLLLAACSEKHDAAGWVQQVSTAHTRADEALAQGDRETAREELEAALQAAAPSDVTTADRRTLQQDLMYRLADVEIASARHQRALDWAERGLALGKQQDVFTSNLLIVRARALEALGRDIDAAHDYYEALQITDALLQQTLETIPSGGER